MVRNHRSQLALPVNVQDGVMNFVNAQRQDEIIEAIVFIAFSLQPISVVSSDGFRRLMKILVPCYKIPCEATILKRLEFLYENIEDKVVRELSRAKSVSLSVDE